MISEILWRFTIMKSTNVMELFVVLLVQCWNLRTCMYSNITTDFHIYSSHFQNFFMGANKSAVMRKKTSNLDSITAVHFIWDKKSWKFDNLLPVQTTNFTSTLKFILKFIICSQIIPSLFWWANTAGLPVFKDLKIIEINRFIGQQDWVIWKAGDFAVI